LLQLIRHVPMLSNLRSVLKILFVECCVLIRSRINSN